MSLVSHFDAAAVGVVLAPPATPMKKLPVHTAPPIQRRPSTHAPYVGLQGRVLEMDMWLFDVTANRWLGRVLADEASNPSTIVYRTTHGRFDVRDGWIVRGRVDGVALWGHVVQTRPLV